MKIFGLFLFLLFNQQGLSQVMMDDETLMEGEVVTLIYVIGCGEWEHFTFSIEANTITASANVPDSWVSCHIDPAPPQFWNRLPLTKLTTGDYVLNLTLTDTNQGTNTIQLNFSIMGGTPMVSAYNKNTLLFLILLFLTLALIHFKPSD